MSRIERAFALKFGTLLHSVGARRAEQGEEWFTRRAETIARSQNIPAALALTRLYQDLVRKVNAWSGRREKVSSPGPSAESVRFLCDAGLGGLARWLRAAGYDALWEQDISDAEIVRRAGSLTATILTTDSLLLERRLIRDKVIPTVWVPPTLGIPEQLAIVFLELGLSRRSPRCMGCGGELHPVAKEAVASRIPPKTYRWRDEYFLCGRCDKLFWFGTHWGRIAERLSEVLS